MSKPIPRPHPKLILSTRPHSIRELEKAPLEPHIKDVLLRLNKYTDRSIAEASGVPANQLPRYRRNITGMNVTTFVALVNVLGLKIKLVNQDEDTPLYFDITEPEKEFIREHRRIFKR
jgi:hypothetical protein